MSSTALAGSRDVIRRILWIQAITIGWMTVEAIFALGAAWRAHSPALFAFGGDSAIELLSALVVYLRFRSKRSGEQAEQLAARIAGGLLFALAACVTLVSVLALLGHREVRPSLLGIGVLSVAAVVMPLLARQKRRLSSATASAAGRPGIWQLRMSPPMSGGVKDRLWDVSNLVALWEEYVRRAERTA
jgi:divalent metal cation (Fe/Co/Zn/Cd) transporter